MERLLIVIEQLCLMLIRDLVTQIKPQDGICVAYTGIMIISTRY